VAMRAAKRDGGKRFRIYEPTMDADAAQSLERELRLRRAVQGEEFFLVYQPIVDAQGEHAFAIEALLRWADPQRGVISPAEFIPVLEQTGLIVPTGRWVLQQACRRGAAWIAEGAHQLVLSVNVSPLQFVEPDFVDMVRGIVEHTGFPPRQLQLEVTEGLLLDPTAESLAKLDALAELGVRLAVDDFGMGYSSLAYLKQFKLHSLKIDRMFVRDIPHHCQDAAIVRAIIDLGHGLGMHVTAEGVETPEQAHALKRLGCDSLQGFLFARPVAEHQVAPALLRRARLRQAPDEEALAFLATDPMPLALPAPV
jgi:diguanylate cyclase